MPNTYKYAAAGGIYTNLDDMSKWVLYLLDDNSKALREYFEYDSIQDFKNLPLIIKSFLSYMTLFIPISLIILIL